MKNRKQETRAQQEPIAKDYDIHYTVPLDEDDREAIERAEAAARRAPKTDPDNI